MSIESKVYLDLARIWNLCPGEVEKIVRDYIGAVTCDFKPLQHYPKPHIYIEPVKIKTLKERLEETQMKATSVQSIENVKEMHLVIDKSSISDIPTKVIVVATTDDDIFEFNLYGEGCAVFADQWSNMDSEKFYKQDWESERNKRQMMERENNLLREKIKKLEQDSTLNKETADTWSKEYYRLSIENEKLKEENKQLKQEKTNLPETPMVDDYLKMAKENEKLTFEKVMLKNENEKLKKENAELKENISRCNKVNEDLGSHAIELEKKISGIRKNSIFEKPLTRAGILDKAKKCVCGQREQDYGTPESNFQLIADLWNGYLGTKYRYPDDNKPINVAPLKPIDVSMMMALLKIARIRNGGGSGDSFVDLAGYAACGGEIWHSNKETN